MKVNIDSGGKPNGVPERSEQQSEPSDAGVMIVQEVFGFVKRRCPGEMVRSEAEEVRRGLGVQGKGAATPLPLLPCCRRKDHRPLPFLSATSKSCGLELACQIPEVGFLDSGCFADNSVLDDWVRIGLFTPVIEPTTRHFNLKLEELSGRCHKDS